MSYLKQNGRRRIQDIDRFGGLDCSGKAGAPGSAYELNNLRLMPDGSLERREGFVPMVDLPGTVRGVCSYLIGDTQETYAVADDQVYYLSQGDNGWAATAIGTLTTQSGEVDFFCYWGTIFLLDGESIRVLTPMSGVVECVPYIPLYGEDWSEDSSETRVICEPINLLSPQIRIRYKLTTGTSNPSFFIGKNMVQSIDKVVKNGNVLAATLYKLDSNYSGSSIIIYDSAASGQVYTVYLTLKSAFLSGLDTVSHCLHASCIGDAENPVAVLYGGENKNCFYLSEPVEKAQMEEISLCYPDVVPLYFPVGCSVTLGDGNGEITGACRHYDRSLIFTTQGVWMTDPYRYINGETTFIPVNTGMGCTAPEAVFLVGNSPISVDGCDIIRWTSQTDERNECNGEVISFPIRSILPRAFAQNAHGVVFKQAREVWLYEPGSDAGVFVWQEDRRSWTRFSGFVPQGMFTLGEQIGFYTQTQIFLFDENAMGDYSFDGTRTGIPVLYASSWMDMGEPRSVKRFLYGHVIADCGEQSVTMTITTPGGRSSSVEMKGSGQVFSVMGHRAGVGRFRYLQIRVTAAEEGYFRLYGVRVSTGGKAREK